ncbi:MAG: DUF4835 family protein [Paludibacteraceae bacterium]|nr:DUF4835 family protein [Paludibacteraceae bacterium]
MRKILFIVALWVAAAVSAQEFQCRVTINSDQIEGSNKQVFETLKTSIEEYVNQNKWTNLQFMEHEKIDCQMLIVVKSVEDNLYTCEMTLQSRRPVYGSSYTTPLMNFQDKNFNFTYQEYDQIVYQQNQFTTNLTAMLAYYCYLMLGYDFDSFQRLGGTPFYEVCEDIVNACQTASMGGTEQKGWLAFDSNRNRYALVNNLMDEAFKPFRQYFYEYHRMGLDIMADNVANGRARIADGINVLKEANRARPATFVINTFLDAKADELVSIFQQGTSAEKQKVYDLLMDIDPTRQNTYDKINQ